MKRSTGAGWQAAGAITLTAWVLAACGLGAGNTLQAPFAAKSAWASQADAGPAPLDTSAASSRARSVGAAIETGQITRIEPIALATVAKRLAAERRAAGAEVVGYRVSVRLENGQSHEFTEPSLDGLKVGDRVQVVRGGPQPA
jgi:hypothetical protein